MKFIGDLEVDIAKLKSPSSVKAAFLDYIRPRYTRYKWQRLFRNFDIFFMANIFGSMISTTAALLYGTGNLGLSFEDSIPLVLGSLAVPPILSLGCCILVSSRAKTVKAVEAFEELYPKIAQEAFRDLEAERARPQKELKVNRSKSILQEEIPGIELREISL